MTNLRILVALALAGFAGGCGFHPLYGDSGTTAGTKDKLASIYVEPIPNRLGYETAQPADRPVQRLRPRIARFLSGCASRSARNREGVALQNDATITRYNDTLTVALRR